MVLSPPVETFSVGVMLKWLFFLLVLFGCFFAETPLFDNWTILNAGRQELLIVASDPEAQWLLFACIFVCMLAFTLVSFFWERRRFTFLDNPEVYFIIVCITASSNYALRNGSSAISTQALTFLFSATIAKWLRSTLFGQTQARQPSIIFNAILYSIVAIISIGRFWYADANVSFFFSKHVRKCGPWGNPNMFGLLTGVATVLNLGLLLERCSNTVFTYNKKGWCQEIYEWMIRAFLATTTSVMLVGTLESYSRGAWLAACSGIFYLLLRATNGPAAPRSHPLKWVLSNMAIITTIISTLAILVFWQFPAKEQLVLRRALSVGNINDFSWRNRVAAWEGVLRIMAEHPWCGVGWNQSEPLYKHYYLSSKLTESAAIQMNDYLTLAATLGIPSLFAFAICAWLSLTSKSEAASQNLKSGIRNLHSAKADWSQAICRAGVIVLLVGFWFDGGLLKLPTAATFWVLLELGGRGMKLA